MGLPAHDCPVRSSGQACDKWSLEWTYTAGGAPVLDTAVGEGLAWTDFDPRVPTTTGTLAGGAGLEDVGAGITAVRFPASRRARVAHCSLEPVTKTSGFFVNAVVTNLDALNGKCRVYLVPSNGAALADPEVGSRVRLVLELEYR